MRPIAGSFAQYVARDQDGRCPASCVKSMVEGRAPAPSEGSVPAWPRYPAVPEPRFRDTLLVHGERRNHEWRRLHVHGYALVLAPMSGEDQPTIRDLAAGANEGVVLAATTRAVSSGTTVVRINSAPHALQRIAYTPTSTHAPSCTRARQISNEAPPQTDEACG